MIVAFGCDQGGFVLKDEIVSYLAVKGIEVKDFGTFSADSVDYPDYAKPVCDSVVNGEADFGILVCGTGIGMSMAANKTHGIRCAVVHDTFSAHATREHNDANVIALGARVIGPGLALDIIDVFLGTPFSHDERHQRRVDKITALDKEY